MTYVMANLHGELAAYREMIKKIKLSKKDILYLLGDVVDYGEESAALLTDLSMCENVYPIAGEHDFVALRMLSGFDRMLKGESTPDADFSAEMIAWTKDGGDVTLAGFRALDAEMREGMIDYLSEFSLFEEAEAGGRQYLLVHAGICGYEEGKELDDYAPEDFFTAPEQENYGDAYTVVVGHTPTASGKIERDGNIIRIDCGAGRGGKLACLCLETGEEFYV